MLENAHTALLMCINGVRTASFLYCKGPPMYCGIAVMLECPNRDPCVWFVVSVVEILVQVCFCRWVFSAISIYQGTNVAGYIVLALVLFDASETLSKCLQKTIEMHPR